MGEIIQFIPKPERVSLIQNKPGASGGEVIRFVSRSERERARLVENELALLERH